MSTHQENIALSEQTPLKSDTDAATGAESTAEGAAAGASAPEKKRWFFTKKTITTKPAEGVAAAESTTGNNNKDVEAGGAPAVKEQHWWQKKCTPGTGQQGENPCMSIGINLLQRDDHQLQTGIDLGFEDIYGEPDSVHSLDAIWRTNYAVFQSVRSFFYKVFSLIVAIPLAVVFGILFALVSTLSVFVFVPAGRLLSIPAGWIFKVWSVVIGAVFDPLFNSLGRIFSNVKVSRYGINSDPTAVLSA